MALRSLAVMEGIFSVLVYSSCSISMILLNKLIMNTYDMNYPNGILILQSGGAVAIISAAKAVKLVDYPAFSKDVARKWLPLTLMFVSMLLTSMLSLGTMSVAAQTVLKNLAVVLTALGDNFFYHKPQTPAVYSAFALMILGSYLGAKGDQWVTAKGLFWTFLNIIATASYTLYMRAVLGAVSSSIGRYGPVFYNNLLSLPFFLVMGFFEIAPFIDAIGKATVAGKVALTFSVLVSSAMTFGVFWCMELTSPTTLSVVGSLNKIPMTFLGMLIFNQFPQPIGYVGIAIAIGAGFLYTYLNILANRAKAAKDKEAAEHDKANGVTKNDIVIRVDGEEEGGKLHSHHSSSSTPNFQPSKEE
ncbi:lipophosphoglycan biosynthetic protein (lpg2) (LPG2) [Leptomonas pyrrhocoris]|uniref:Lipophosphoglycan biosynthetic protein (Lpg2) (LPG2) n=1 Tax=Leptomonas pyrrhocoris TaxID=157538 RepID=A0A0M9G519_LEPPY|nr:lipophosphoglycan biosynthetic protein (lpg2) (LPG2) [Leptomonas pyrrhocoris]XP_015660836.1 lipophosphoglycan biosynthetic protein (lpg2) (LPG2) [Leptomonas pyrrhocoris]KPA82396.1 lipophosphoglycan biosynthetic protein (lpg2) (LPG2) [Leptomonas pyrrhocoris]KPA82397.1 lipophosphoglycan biosynthetic protein (lpg2) (LPG2) [Leptomonas pyrrhocoris]|eukprot:XP_015660835.1 lipophosphoglycan biosynthetic protein (lpg2) (LPG2) [Leptomonas pyrrhocoris]